MHNGGQLAAQSLALGPANPGDMTGESAVTTAWTILIIPPNRLVRPHVRQVFDIIVRCAARQRDRHAVIGTSSRARLHMVIAVVTVVGAHDNTSITRLRAPPS